MAKILHNPEDIGIGGRGRNINTDRGFSFKFGGKGAGGAGVTIVQHSGKPPLFDTQIIHVDTGKRK